MSRSFPEYIQSYFDSLTESGRKASTIKQYVSDLDKFLTWLEDYKDSIELDVLKNLSDDDYKTYITYLQNAKHSAATIRRLFSVLRGFLTFLNITISFKLNQAEIEGLRELTAKDFISEDDFKTLLKSMKTKDNADTPLAAARDQLIDRNVAIVLLIRFYGLTPKEISLINMANINFPQNTLEIPAEHGQRTFTIIDEHKKWILNYFNSIPKDRRPRYYSADPLFVAYNNRYESYQYDHAEAKPKRLSVRAIQEMIKDEVRRAGLRKLSAVNLRNQCILDALRDGKTEETILFGFNLTTSLSLYRYRKYRMEIENKKRINQIEIE